MSQLLQVTKHKNTIKISYNLQQLKVSHSSTKLTTRMSEQIDTRLGDNFTTRE